MIRRIVDPPINPDEKHTSVWRSMIRSLEGIGITILRSPHEFSKKTPGVKEGVDYLLEDRKLKDLIKSTRADITDVLIPLEILDDEPEVENTHHGRETVSLARTGRAHVRDAIQRGDRVLSMRGAHDAFDFSGALEALNGEIGLIIVDAHADGHSPETSISKSPHGMWVKTMVGDAGDLDRIMKDCPNLKPENIIYIGVNQPDGPDEEAFLEEIGKKGTVITAHDMQDAGKMKELYEAIDSLQQRVPIWFELDEDGLIDAAASMPGGGVSEQQVKEIATRIGSNQLLENMQQVVGIGVSEFEAPTKDSTDEEIQRAERQAETVKAVVHRAFGAGYHEDPQDKGVELDDEEAQKKRELLETPESAVDIRRRIRKITTTALAGTVAVLGTIAVWTGWTSVGQSKKIEKQQQTIERLVKEVDLAGLPKASVWSPSLSAIWSSPDKSAIELFQLSDFQNSVSNLSDDEDNAYTLKQMHTFLQAALLRANDDEVMKVQIRQEAFRAIPEQFRADFATNAVVYEASAPHVQELESWMKQYGFWPDGE